MPGLSFLCSFSNNFKTKFHQGFTLIELLIVITIIGVLSIIVFVSASGAKDRARVAKILLFSGSAQDLLGSDVRGIYTFDDGTANDSSGYNNNGTIYGATFVGGILASGEAMSFNGSSYIDAGNGASLNFGTGDFSLSAWFNISSLPSAWQTIVSKGDSGSNGYGIEISSGNQYTCSVQATGGSNAHLSSNTPTLNQWHNIVCVFDRDAGLYMYADGVLLANNSAYMLANSGSVDTASHLFIGAHTATTWNFSGFINEIRIYDQAAPLTSIQKHYAEGLLKHQVAQK